MLVVGVIEIIAGIGVALKPRIFAYVVAAWLAVIIINLLLIPGYFDVALRDFGLFLAALALARLSQQFAAPDMPHARDPPSENHRRQQNMTNYQYLIIGGGMTAAAAADGIREVDATGSIGIVSAEPDAPYDRPPLSKALWKGTSIDTIWRKTKDKQVEMHLGRTIKEIVPKQKRVVDDKGNIFTYEKLLLATGGRPRRLSFGDDQIIYYRTLADYRRLRALARSGRRFAVIGGGFIGSEIAAALAMNGKEVVMIFPGKDIGERLFPRGLSQFVSSVYQEKGVELLAGEKVVALKTRGDQHVLKTDANREIVVDAVVAGIGLELNIELAQSAGLKTGNGIVVNEFLRTSHPDIYAAGDVAEFYNPPS